MTLNPKILIIDDAKFARSIVKRALINGGYDNISEVDTAKEALIVFKNSKPELTLLDITLADCSDLSLLKELLEISPNARIIINSAMGQPDIIREAIDIGARDFVTKPFNEPDFLCVVRTVLEND